MSSENDEASVDVSDHELGWMFTDSTGLVQLERFESALLILLCAMDACANRRYPRVGVRERFESFLRDRMPKFTRVQNFNIMVPERGEFMRIEEILYRLLRNAAVHEGARFDFGDRTGYGVVIDWSKAAGGVHVDPTRAVVVLRGGWLVDVLAGILKEALAEDLLKAKGIEIPPESFLLRAPDAT